MRTDGSVRLAAYPGVVTDDVDEARDWVGRALRPHRLRLRGSGLHAVHHVAELSHSAFHYIDYGCDIDVSVEPLGFVLVQFPVSGASVIRSRGEEVLVRPGSAAVVSGVEPLTMRYLAPNPRLMLRIDSDRLESRLAMMLGTKPKRPLRFDLSVDLASERARSWRSMVDLVFDDLEHGGVIGASPLAADSLQQSIIDGLLVAARHSHSELLAEPGHVTRPRTLRRAMTLIEDHCAEPLTTADIAEAVGVSVRSLQEAFQIHLGTTPMANLRTVRLHRVREELLTADPLSTRVGDVALRWGVTHVGRFGQEYRALFGETPSDTLRRRM